MCKKVSYWSINYTQQKCDNSEKNFNNCYPKYKTWSSYEQTLKC